MQLLTQLLMWLMMHLLTMWLLMQLITCRVLAVTQLNIPKRTS